MKVSIELPVATRHHLDMTEKLLKATLNPNTQKQQCSVYMQCTIFGHQNTKGFFVYFFNNTQDCVRVTFLVHLQLLSFFRHRYTIVFNLFIF